MVHRSYSCTCSLPGACLLFLLILACFQTGTLSWSPPRSSDDHSFASGSGWEPVEAMRRRLGLSYNYTPTLLNPERCRYLTEEECKDEDRSMRRHAQSHRSLGVDGNSPTSGTIKVLVLLIQFTDHTSDRTLADKSVIESLWNDVIVPWLMENSQGAYKAEPFFADWTLTDNTEKYYSFGEMGIVPELKQAMYPALDKLDEMGIDWSQFDSDGDGELDSVVMMHSGIDAVVAGADCYGRESVDRIYSHARTGTNMDVTWTSMNGLVKLVAYAVTSTYDGNCDDKPATAGLTVHEFMHTLGLQDLYNDPPDVAKGVGSWDVMANPYGHDDSGTPGFLSVYSREQVNWVMPTTIEFDGIYTLKPAQTSSEAYKIVLVDGGASLSEYLLIENRQKISFDQTLFGNGLMIYHIDNDADGMKKPGWPGQPGWPENGNHYFVAVLPKDGRYDLEQDENSGDVGDMWLPDDMLGPGMGSTVFPNTDGYQAGLIDEKGITISVLSQEANRDMTFEVKGLRQAPGGTTKTPELTLAPEVPEATPETETLPPASTGNLSPSDAETTIPDAGPVATSGPPTDTAPVSLPTAVSPAPTGPTMPPNYYGGLLSWLYEGRFPIICMPVTKQDSKTINSSKSKGESKGKGNKKNSYRDTFLTPKSKSKKGHKSKGKLKIKSDSSSQRGVYQRSNLIPKSKTKSKSKLMDTSKGRLRGERNGFLSGAGIFRELPARGGRKLTGFLSQAGYFRDVNPTARGSGIEQVMSQPKKSTSKGTSSAKAKKQEYYDPRDWQCYFGKAPSKITTGSLVSTIVPTAPSTPKSLIPAPTFLLQYGRYSAPITAPPRRRAGPTVAKSPVPSPATLGPSVPSLPSSTILQPRGGTNSPSSFSPTPMGATTAPLATTLLQNQRGSKPITKPAWMRRRKPPSVPLRRRKRPPSVFPIMKPPAMFPARTPTILFQNQHDSRHFAKPPRWRQGTSAPIRRRRRPVAAMHTIAPQTIYPAGLAPTDSLQIHNKSALISEPPAIHNKSAPISEPPAIHNKSAPISEPPAIQNKSAPISEPPAIFPAPTPTVMFQNQHGSRPVARPTRWRRGTIAPIRRRRRRPAPAVQNNVPPTNHPADPRTTFSFKNQHKTAPISASKMRRRRPGSALRGGIARQHRPGLERI